MKRVFVKIYRYILKLQRLSRWALTIPAQRKTLRANHPISEGVNGRIMVLIPHSDDEWIGTSQLIDSSQDVLLCNMNMNGADNPELHHKRYLEMEQNAKHFSRELVQIVEPIQLANRIRQYKPDYVFVPFIIDWHDEHHAVLGIMYDALAILADEKERLRIGMYQVSVPIPEAAVTHCLGMPLSGWLKKWHTFLTAYPSQKEIAYQRFALQEVINGKYSSSWAGEVYSIWDTQHWCELYLDLTPDQKIKEQIKTRLNDIVWIRECVSTLWDEGRKKLSIT